MNTNKHNYKLTDAQFIEAYRASDGNYTKTAKYIQQHFGIPYTKQSVQDRALNLPEEVDKLFAIIDNQSATTLMKFADDEANDIKLRARVYAQLMNKVNQREKLKLRLAKKNSTPENEDQPDVYFDMDDHLLHFADNEDLSPEEKLEWEQFCEGHKKPDVPPQNP